jgi:hypothetical protein
VNAFDRCSEHFDVFKVETKADSSYMVVAGIQDRPVQPQRRESSTVYYRKSMYIFPFRFNRVNQQHIVFH